MEINKDIEREREREREREKEKTIALFEIFVSRKNEE